MHKGFTIAVFTRSEHCPPHVHVGNDRWDARFEFSFWHNGVRLWDVIPQKNQPTVSLLEGIRQTMLLPENLRRAREAWWGGLQTVCLVNQLWNDNTRSTEVNRFIKSPAKLIRSATFDATAYRTILILAGLAAPVEIQLS